ncbi:uncharacterized protein [Equus asinus]|uniref:uncharacterized protein isoform X2 n=1 Tax=Equus asinus TaxID=9793 RepID=UPI0038F6619C
MPGLELGRGPRAHCRRRREKGPPGFTLDRRTCPGEVVDRASLPQHTQARTHTHTHTHTLTLTHAWPDPRLAPSHLRPRPARGCGGYSPSARERISDTVLRMVGIAAAAAGGSSAGTLHLSRRRAGGRPGSRERSAASRAGSATHPGQRGGRARPPHAGWSRRRRERRRQRWRSGTSLYKVGFLWLDEHESEAKLKRNLIESWVLH